MCHKDATWWGFFKDSGRFQQYLAGNFECSSFPQVVFSQTDSVKSTRFGPMTRQFLWAQEWKQCALFYLGSDNIVFSFIGQIVRGRVDEAIGIVS